MIHSMTGFGTASFRVGAIGYAVEVRSVNHRHLDARVRVPRLLSALEPELRARVQARVTRGKIDCSISAPDGAAPGVRLEIDREAARAYARAARELREEDGVSGELDVATLLSLPGVARLSEPELDPEAVREAAQASLDEALDALVAMREREGQALERDLRQRLDEVEALAVALDKRAGEVQESARERLRRRMRQLEAETGPLDPARLHQEVALAVDRLDVTEEIVRLRSHVAQFRETLASAGAGRPVGRRLEFLLQELSREANTIGAKGSDAPIAHAIVDLKTELERLREQVQNVE